MTENTPTPRRSPAERPAIDEQFWPINLLLLVLGAVVSGAIVARADFAAPLLGQTRLWLWIGGVWVIVGLVIVAAWQLGDRSARRLQLSAVLAILLIFFALTYFGDRAVLFPPEKGGVNVAAAKEEPEEKPPLPAIIQAPDEPKQQLAFEKIVEVQVAPEAIARVEPAPVAKQIVAPREQPVEQAPQESPIPKVAQLNIPREQIEKTVPRQSESESQLSRQLNAAKPQAGEPEAPKIVGPSTSDQRLDAQAANVQAPRLATGVQAPSGQSPAREPSSPTPAAPPRGSSIRRVEAAPETIAMVTERAKGRPLAAPAAPHSAPVDAPASAVVVDSAKPVPTEPMRMAQRQAASSPLNSPAAATQLTDAQFGEARPLPGSGTLARPGGAAGTVVDVAAPAGAGSPAPGRQIGTIPRLSSSAPQSDPSPGAPQAEGRPGPAETVAGPVHNDRRGALGAPIGPAAAGGFGPATGDTGVSGRIAGTPTIGRALAGGAPEVSSSGSSRAPLQPHRGPAGGLPVSGIPSTADLALTEKITPAGTGGGGGGGGNGAGGGGTSPEAARGALALGPAGGGGGVGPPSGLPSGGEIAALESTRGFGGTSGGRDSLRGAAGGGGGGDGGSGSGAAVVASGTGAGSSRSSRGPFSAPTRSEIPQLPGDPGSTRETAQVGNGPADGSGTGKGGSGQVAGGVSGPSLIQPGANGVVGEAGDGGTGTERGILGTRNQIGHAELGIPGGTDTQVAAWSPDGKQGGSGRKVGEARMAGANLSGPDLGSEGTPEGAGGDGSGGNGKGAGGGGGGADRVGPVQLVAGVRGGTGTDPSGPQVLVAAPDGSGGLGEVTSQFAGNVSLSAQPQSEVVVASTDGRFLRRDVGGPRTTVNATPVESHGSFLGRTGGAGGRGTGTQPQQIDIKIARALSFLQRQQAADGSWSLHNADGARSKDSAAPIHSNVAATGLALLAFLGDRHHHLETQGEYNYTIDSAIDYLIKHQSPTGEIFVKADANSDTAARTYSHAIATLALCEAYGMTGDPKLKEPAQRAINFAVSTQHKKLGGWRYTPQIDSDTSITGWMFAALDAGSRAQLNVPRTAFDGVDRWLDFATAPRSRGSQFVYNPQAVDELVPVKGITNNRSAQRQASPVNTAVGLYVRLTRGWNPTDPRVQQGADYLMKNLPEHTKNGRNTYYWYYATQVMYHVQGPRWKKWQQRLSDELEQTQVQDGPLEGSWDPLGSVPDKWGAHGGRIFVTAMNLLSLEASSRVADSPTPLKVK